MPDSATFGVFLAAAIVLAITPGPGIFYVLARSLHGGRREGYVSAAGTAVGGLFHVVAAALGLSALLAASSSAFTILKYLGAAYLIYLGLRALLSADPPLNLAAERRTSRRTFAQGVMTEVLNPKTALFFLAFIPQFVNPHGLVVLEFLLLGSISVCLNSSVDLIVVTLAGPIGSQLQRRAPLRKAPRLISGASLIALGAYVAIFGEKGT